MLSRCLQLLVLLCNVTFAQRVSVGLKAGVPISTLAVAGPERAAGVHHYTFGPAFRVLLFGGLQVGFECLYKRFDPGYSASPRRLAVHRLEWPLYLRYELRRGPATPFLQAGLSFNR